MQACVMVHRSPFSLSDCTCHLTTIPLYPMKPTLWEWIHVKHHAWEMERQIIKDKEMSKEIYLKEAWERTCRQDTKGNQWKETLQKNIMNDSNTSSSYLFAILTRKQKIYEKHGLQGRVTHNLSSVWKIIWRSAIIHGSVNSSWKPHNGRWHRGVKRHQLCNLTINYSYQNKSILIKHYKTDSSGLQTKSNDRESVSGPGAVGSRCSLV